MGWHHLDLAGGGSTLIVPLVESCSGRPLLASLSNPGMASTRGLSSHVQHEQRNIHGRNGGRLALPILGQPAARATGAPARSVLYIAAPAFRYVSAARLDLLDPDRCC